MRDLDYSAYFSQDGVLAKKIKSFHSRPQQLEMANAVALTIQNQTSLVVEAATGTGKTFAYLVPALLSGQKILIATASKTLQDQLVFHDLPKMISSLGIARTVQNLKGRDNYICQYQIKKIATQSADEAHLYTPEISKIYTNLPKVKTGEKTDISFIPEDSPIWYGLTASSEHCIGNKCPMLNDCFMYKARQKAMAADVVVVNHHLFFADSRLKNDGFGALLPAFDIFIFDEAHQLPDIATQFFSQGFSSAQLLRLIDEVSAFLALYPDMQSLCLSIDNMIEDALLHLLRLDEPTELQKVQAQGLFPLGAWIESFSQLKKGLQQLPVDAEQQILKLIERLSSVLGDMQRCLNQDKNGIAWVKPLKRHVRVQWSPFEVSGELKTLLGSLSAARVFTSATLRIGENFDWFSHAMGLENTQFLNLSSPFDWDKQALFYVPHGMPDPKDSGYYLEMIQKVIPIINRLGGKTFLLFTSHKGLQYVSQELIKRLAFPVLVQGTLEKRLLLDAFRSHGHAVLCGTGSFWEGVDVQGAALSCVIIDKLPFANVTEPWMMGKMRSIQAQGLSSFEDYLLPQAIIALKQGVGRLIRTERDKGLLVMMDPRVIGRNYGLTIKESLPAMTWTRMEERVMAFIEEMDLEIVV